MVPDRQAMAGAYLTSAPQSYELDVLPIEQAIQRTLDARLRIIWNPCAFLARPGTYDAEGKLVPPTHDGRWQVVLPGLLDGEPTIIHTLGTELGPEKPYRAVGWWLLDFLQQWDAANVETVQRIQADLAQNDALDHAWKATQRETDREGVERFTTDWLGVKQYPGRGAQFVQ